MNVYLMAQGKGSRWKEGSRRNPRFMKEAPPYKQLLEVSGEPIICRSVRQFHEEGLNPVVVADYELLVAARLPGIILNDPGDDILQGVLNLMASHPPKGITIIALGDVLFSDHSIRALANVALQSDMGCMARVDPSRVCSKKADEVFAIWFASNAWKNIAWRMERMLTRGQDLRPSKPWAFPFAVSRTPDMTRAAYESGQGLKAIRNRLLVTDDYTDDIDSADEWIQFWDDLREVAEADNENNPD